eukprot:TCALIF_00117-PA protein Name:"Similar to lov Protein jim lovell (Drosophila melanogaster)" AED:0.34 eAED:0.33 QI:536/0.25/0.2/0.6/1/1/5/0/598
MEPDSADPSRAKTYHLKWSSHIPNLETVFTTLLESESLSDVTLVCSDGSIKSHRLLLASCSNYFLRVFLETPTKKPMIVVPEITTETMKHLLAFIYTGEVRVVEEVLENLIAAATMLQIRGLATASENEGGLDDSVEVTTNYQGLNKSKDRSFDEEVTPLEKLSPKKSESRESSPSRKSESSPMKRMRSTYDSSPIPEVSILPILAPRLNLEQPQYIEEEDNNRPKQSSDFNGEDSLQESEDPESTYSHPQTQHLLNQSSQIHPGLGTLENMYNHFLQGKITPSPSSAPDSPTVSSKSSNNSVTTVANLSIQQEEIARLMAQPMFHFMIQTSDFHWAEIAFVPSPNINEIIGLKSLLKVNRVTLPLPFIQHLYLSFQVGRDCVILLCALVLSITRASVTDPIDEFVWTNPADSLQYQICNLTTECFEQDNICITWSMQLNGLCVPKSSTPQCSFNSDCSEYSDVCEFGSVQSNQDPSKVSLSGFCVPALFYMWDPIECSQAILQPLPCDKDIQHQNLDEEIDINRYCHRADGLNGKCLRFHCNNHLDCGMNIVDSTVFVGSCIHGQCEYQMHPNLIPTDERILGVLKAMNTQNIREEF